MSRRVAATAALVGAAASLVTPTVIGATAAPAAAAPILPLTSQVEVAATSGADGANAASSVTAVVTLVDGTRASALLSRGWAGNTRKSTTVSLPRHALKSEIQRISIEFAPDGGDNLDVQGVVATTSSSVTGPATIVSVSGSPYARMNGAVRAVTLPFTAGHTVAARPVKADLRADQTAARDQGSRRTCITFAAIAAVEAAYKRVGVTGPGGAELDLSEEFRTWVGKMFWLSRRSDVPTANSIENQLSTTDGGNGVQTLEGMVDGIRVPTEIPSMPYMSSVSGYGLPKTWDQYTTQREVDDVNLDPARFPDAARAASTYYGITGSTRLLQPNLPAELEAVLASGREVVVDLDNLQHAVLLVGYDRTDPNRPVFFFKDSAGILPAAGEPYGEVVGTSTDVNVSNGPITSAAFVTGVRTPGPWVELSFVGRWNLSYDGWRGVLDISHIPGTATTALRRLGVTTPDRRIGTFFDHNGTAHRVNGWISGTTIEFYIDASNPNADYGALGGRRFRYTLQRTANGGVAYTMSGTHTDPGGGTFGGWARRDAVLPSSTPLATPLSVASYRGATFAATWSGLQGTLRLDPTSTPSSTNPNVDNIRAVFTYGPGSTEFFVGTLGVDRTYPGKVTLQRGTTYAPQTALKLGWEPGVLAGEGLVLVKTG